jgi:carbon storage regulator
MLALSRRRNESIVINDDITIVVLEIRDDKVRLGIEAPNEVPVSNRDVFDAIHRTEREDEACVPTRPKAEPADIALSGRHVALVDRLRDAVLAKGGRVPSRKQVVAAILDAVARSEEVLGSVGSLDDLRSLLAGTTSGGTP